MKIHKNCFSFLLVVFLFSIFLILSNPSFSYATSSKRYWSSSVSVSYGGNLTYKMTIDGLMKEKGICVEANTGSPNYCASCKKHGEIGTLYNDDEIRATWPDFYNFAQKVITLYKTSSVPGSYDQFANAHLALSRKYSNQCNVKNETCDSIVNQVNASSAPTVCYKMYLITHSSYQDGVYFDTSTTVDCPGSEPEPEPEPTVSSTTLSSKSTITVGSNAAETSGKNSHKTSSHPISFSYDGTDTVSVSFHHKVSRTKNTDIASAPYKYCTGSSSCTPSTDGAGLASGGNSGNLGTTTITVQRGNTTGLSGSTFTIAPGDSNKKLCQYINFSPTTYSSDGSSSGSNGSYACVKVSREAKPEPVITTETTTSTSTSTSDATSTGRVVISPATASNFDCSGSNCTAKQGVSGNQTFNISYQMRRTDKDNAPSGASGFNYSTAKAQYNKSSGYSLGGPANLSYSASFSQVTSGTKTVNISAGGSSTTVCGYLTYESKVNFSTTTTTTTTNTYTDGVLTNTSSSTSVSGPTRTGANYGKANNCITVYMPPIYADAKFDGKVSIEPVAHVNLSCSGTNCQALRDSTGDNAFSFSRAYSIRRFDGDSNAPATKSAYGRSSSSFPSSRNKQTSAIAYNDSAWKVLRSDSPSVESKRGDSTKKVCGYIDYENIVHYQIVEGVTSETGTRGTDKTSKCYSIQAPPPDQIQNFSASSTLNSVSGASWNDSKSAYLGQEGTGSYDLSFSHSITRGSPNNSANIPNKYATNTYAVYQKLPASNSYTAIGDDYKGTNEKINISKSHTYSLSLDANQKETYCERIRYKPSITYAYGYLPDNSLYQSGDRTYGSNANSTAACAKVIRPAYSTFDARVVITSGYDSSTYSSETGDGNFVGTGKRRKYNFSIAFQIKRTDTDGIPSSPEIRYKTSYGTNASQPTSASNASTKTFSNNKWVTVQAVNSDALDIHIGTDPVNYCAYLSYDTGVSYYGTSTPEDRSFTGRKKVCVKITNPSLTYTASFSASSTATDLRTSGLTLRSDGTYEITNYSYTTDPTTGARTYTTANLPKNVTISFIHNIERTDSGTTKFELRDSSGALASTRYRVYSSTNGGASWSSSPVTSGTKSNLATSGSNKKTSVTNDMNLKFGTTNSGGRFPVGTYVTYCQKIEIDATTKYWTKDSSNLEDYEVGREYSGYDKKPAAKCVTIRNPHWDEFYNGTIIFPITVTGSTLRGTNINAQPNASLGRESSPRLSGTTQAHVNADNHTYTASAVDITATFEHELHRSVESFMENGSAIAQSFTVTPGDGTSNYTVTVPKPTDSVSPTYTVNQKLAGASTSLSGTTVTLAPEASWNSIKKTAGTTSTSLNGSSLVAGATKEICHKIVYGKYYYTINYQKRYRQEKYDAATYGNTSKNGTAWHLNTIRNTPHTVNGPTTTNNAAEKCLKVYRPYNYQITDITPSDSSHQSSTVGYADDSINVDFSIAVKKEDAKRSYTYITDLEDSVTEIAVFAITVDRGNETMPNQLSGSHTGAYANPNAICSNWYNFSGKKDCKALGGLPTKPKDHHSTGVYSANNANSGYSTSYSPGTISVPNNLVVGDKYCISMAIRNRSSGSTEWFISKSTCVTVSKKPSIHVLGGSVLADGGITTSHSLRKVSGGTAYYGSWSDFSLLSKETITKMASGAAISTGLTSATECKMSPLTLRNNACSSSTTYTSTGSLGKANHSRSSNDFFKKMRDKLIPTTSTNSASSCTETYGFSSYSYNVLSSSCGGIYATGNNTELYYRTTGQLTGNVMGVPTTNRTAAPNTVTNSSDKAIIFYSPKDIEITRNMITSHSGSNGSAIPAFIIIAEGNIKIDEDVTRLDAWIVAQGELNTSSINGTAKKVSDTNFDVDTCSNRLEINGPVYAGSIELPRTYGSEYSRITEAAEEFDYNPATIIWGYNQASDKTPNVTYLKELSPRY